jgi:hypothetical protein
MDFENEPLAGFIFVFPNEFYMVIFGNYCLLHKEASGRHENFGGIFFHSVVSWEKPPIGRQDNTGRK